MCFCSTATIHSSKDVEQLLGRVLRMPYARRRKAAALNKAYAHVSSPDFVNAAKELETSLIEMGFEDAEAKQAIEPSQPSIPNLPLHLQLHPLTLAVERPPDLEGLTEHEQQSVIIKNDLTGSVSVELHVPVTPAVRERVLASVAPAERHQTEQKIEAYFAGHTAQLSPAERGEKFVVPRLCVRYQGELLPFDADLMLDAAGWDITVCSTGMDDVRFDDTSKSWEFDVADGKVTYKFTGEQQLDLNVLVAEWTQTDLVRWLDKSLHQKDIAQERLLAWLDSAINGLRERKFDLATLVRGKFILARKLEDKIKQCRVAAYENGYQQLLFEPNSVVETTYAYSFPNDPNCYPANWYYQGRHQFKKHFYALPGELKSEGDELDCAIALDAQSAVKHWVRNLSNQPEASMWIQTKTDRFYPDFLAELNDGRLLMVEYKGEGWSDSEDTREKRRLGDLWAEKSEGKALFSSPRSMTKSAAASLSRSRQRSPGY